MGRNRKARIALDDVSFSYQGYKEKALADISAHVDVGEEFWIVGPNSSGKTTLVSIIAGVIPTVMEGELEGSILSMPDDGSCLPVVSSLLMQDSGVYLFATVREEISYSLENCGVPLDGIEGRLRSLAQEVGIVDLLERSMHTLSGGQRQKVALAATLALEPDVLILDEPFEQLDPASASEVIALSRELARNGTTLIVATREAPRIPKEAQTLYLDGGRVVERIGVKEYAPKQSHGQSTETLLEMDRVGYSYPKGPGVRDISLRVNSGRVLGLLGENGAGKSTIIKQTVGLLRPDSGVIKVCGVDTSNRSVQELSRSVGMLFQNPDDQIFNADVISEVAWSLTARGMRKDAARESARAILEELGIAHLADANPFEIPSSARQLVAFASILVTNPRLIVLDEPTKALDVESAGTVLGAIERRLAQGAGALIVTHDIEFIAHIADECVLMSGGGIIGFDETTTILADEALMRRARLIP